MQRLEGQFSEKGKRNNVLCSECKEKLIISNVKFESEHNLSDKF